ncbi:MAG: hypothetical protein FWD49_07235, partial [Firmicutes bacterium]|nr:hypothetical protein [Bacillota bacterium]
ARIFAIISYIPTVVFVPITLAQIFLGNFITMIIVLCVCLGFALCTSLVASIKYHKHGRENAFDRFYYRGFRISQSIFESIFGFIIAIFASNDEKSRKPAKTTDLGSGYIKQNEYGNYDMYVGNETSGYTKTSLKDYNPHSGEASDYKGNKYKVD